MGVGGDGVADPAGGGPGRPVGAAHGALAAPGRGPRAEGVSLGLSVLLWRRIIYFSLIRACQFTAVQVVGIPSIFYVH